MTKENHMAKIKVGILGATAYTGLELVKILVKHPNVEISFISSKSFVGNKFSSIFGEATGILDDILISTEEAVGKNVGCVFSCLPHALSAEICIPFIEKGIRAIDLSADFRINDPEVYKKWYQHDHPKPGLLNQAVFGLPELYRDDIKDAKILANPGCYPTSIILPLLPLLKSSGVEITSIIADSKSGVSGAGRTLKLLSHFVEANENMVPYSLGRTHRHLSEIDQELSKAAGKKIEITFSPHLSPLNRGILSTIYLSINKTADECYAIANNFYKSEPFIRFRTRDDLPKVSYVANTNYCDIAFTGGEEGQPVIAVSTIDNLIKGASGQAVQNFNIMFGFDEVVGLL